MRCGMWKKVFCAQCAAHLTGFAMSTRALYDEAQRQAVAAENKNQKVLPDEGRSKLGWDFTKLKLDRVSSP